MFVANCSAVHNHAGPCLARDPQEFGLILSGNTRHDKCPYIRRFNMDQWHAYRFEPMLVDAIFERLVQNAYPSTKRKVHAQTQNGAQV